MKYEHKSVLLDEAVDALNVQSNGIYVDCTVGGGGHSAKILDKLQGGKLIAIDKDEDALTVCKKRLKGNVSFIHCDFKWLGEVLRELRIDKVDGILVDLGVSSYQIDNPERGFSYMVSDAPLDMRMDASQSLSAKDIVNSYSEAELCKLIRDFGEEKFAKSIARNIVAERQKNEIETCGQLVEIIERSVPHCSRKKGSHPAKRTFQALRIEVNKELDGIDAFLKEAVDLLNPNGRLAVITFHSLEDRIVKQCFADFATDCICPPSFPKCVCGHRAKGVTLFKKPIEPSAREQQDNPRSKSAKLRVFVKK